MIIKCKNKGILSNIFIILERYDTVQRGKGTGPGTPGCATELVVYIAYNYSLRMNINLCIKNNVS